MHDLVSLTKRHILKFLRDKTAVFFSFLSVFILLALYFLFIGASYTSGPLFENPLIPFSKAEKNYIIAGVMMGGILVINTLSLSLGIMGNLITDLEQKRLDAFLVTPVKRYKIILSYYLSSIIVTSVLTLFMWVLTYFYVGLTTTFWYPFETFLVVSLLLILYTLISASLMIFLVTLLKSVNAFGTLSGVLGTFIGFMSGIYMPLVVLGPSMKYVASVLPFTHMSIILKDILLEGPYQMMLDKGIPIEAINDISQIHGASHIGFLGLDVPMIWIMIVSIALSMLLLFFAYRNMTKKMVK